MNYQAAYDHLIAYRREHPAAGYTEKHHIVMRSMGGSNVPTNLVVLTGREHWIAHLLLHKIHCNSQTMYACHMMAMRCEERGIAYIKNSRMYEKIRKECATLTSMRMQSSQSGKGNSQYGTRWICNILSKENMKISKDDMIPDGWVSGRNRWIVKHNTKPKRDKLDKMLCITDGVHNKRIYYTDQLPIPDGWFIGITYSNSHMSSIKNARRKHNFSLKGSSGQGGWKKRNAGMV